MELAQKLVSTRRGTLLVAAAAALLAGVSIVLYLNSYRETLKGQGALVTVLVARDTIPKGTAGNVVDTKDLYTVRTMPESQLLEGAFSDPASLDGKVAARSIFEGAQLTATDFTGAADSPAATLTDRERVVAVPLDSAHGLIGTIEAGDRIDVYAGFNVVEVGPDGSPRDGGVARAVLKQILTNIPVVAVGEKGSGAGSKNTNISLKLDDKEAWDLAYSSDNGKVWFALRPSAGAKSTPPELVTVETILLGVPPLQIQRSLGGRR